MAQQLFLSSRTPPPAPLADRMRPRTIDEYVDQQHLLGPDRPLRLAIESRRAPSCIFWGPPGTGKTTLARLLAQATDTEFVPFSAVLGGVKELREILDEARDRRNRIGRGTTLFVDEIHRFNRSQQDAFLPHVENGLITLLGATTENPSFELNAALLSRVEVFVLHPLTEADLLALLRPALTDRERGLGRENLPIDDPVLEAIASQADGDARRALNLLEQLAETWRTDRRRPERIDLEYFRRSSSRKNLRYDRASEEHYNIASAFIKSMRGSDPDASLYWMARMLEGGEDPTFIARRMVIFASEDVGNGDPRALQIAVAAAQAVDLIGLPECVYNLSQAVLYLATAPKSNSAKAYFAALEDARQHGSLPVPMHIRNAPTRLMKAQGYGEGYLYPHDFPGHYVQQTYLPDRLQDRRYFQPSAIGYEKTITERLEYHRRLAERARAPGSPPLPATAPEVSSPEVGRNAPAPDNAAGLAPARMDTETGGTAVAPGNAAAELGSTAAGTDGTEAGTDGTTAGTDGTAAGTGGTAAGTDGTAARTDGTAVRTDGTAAGTGGTAAGTDGTAAGTGGAEAGTGRTATEAHGTAAGTDSTAVAAGNTRAESDSTAVGSGGTTPGPDDTAAGIDHTSVVEKRDNDSPRARTTRATGRGETSRHGKDRR